jgi:hypothetical protein
MALVFEIVLKMAQSKLFIVMAEWQIKLVYIYR